VFVVMLAEQTLINGAVITVDITSGDAALAGIVFSILLIARAPLQLFQAIQGSLLPHLAGLNATEDGGEFSRAIRITVLAIAGFATAVAVGLMVLGPWAMDLLFDLDYDWSRFGLGVVAIGMGLHLAAGTLNQAALARGHSREAAVAWAIVGVVFVGWMFSPVVDDEVLRAELGYALAAALLCALLTWVYHLRPDPTHAAAASA
jgi:O-antigen/teichoic acid export membrane protein